MILFFYIFLYCNAADILNKLYLSNFATVTNNELIQYNTHFYYSITNQNSFALLVYSIYIIKIVYIIIQPITIRLY